MSHSRRRSTTPTCSFPKASSACSTFDDARLRKWRRTTNCRSVCAAMVPCACLACQGQGRRWAGCRKSSACLSLPPKYHESIASSTHMYEHLYVRWYTCTYVGMIGVHCVRPVTTTEHCTVCFDPVSLCRGLVWSTNLIPYSLGSTATSLVSRTRSSCRTRVVVRPRCVSRLLL
jgi:hypothetical protein